MSGRGHLGDDAHPAARGRLAPPPACVDGANARGSCDSTRAQTEGRSQGSEVPVEAASEVDEDLAEAQSDANLGEGGGAAGELGEEGDGGEQSGAHGAHASLDRVLPARVREAE